MKDEDQNNQKMEQIHSRAERDGMNTLHLLQLVFHTFTITLIILDDFFDLSMESQTETTILREHKIELTR